MPRIPAHLGLAVLRPILSKGSRWSIELSPFISYAAAGWVCLRFHCGTDQRKEPEFTSLTSKKERKISSLGTLWCLSSGLMCVSQDFSRALWISPVPLLMMLFLEPRQYVQRPWDTLLVKAEAKAALTTSPLSSPAVTKSLLTLSSRPTFSFFILLLLM